MSSIFLFSNSHSSIKEVHFNLWMIGDDPFIDVGIKIGRGQKLKLFLPIENACIDDLYETISDHDVLNAIFNQHLRISRDDAHSFITVTRNSNDKFDVVRACLKENKLEIENATHNYRFTELIIEAEPQALNVDMAYVRLRVRGFKDNVFNKKHEETVHGISPYLETIEVIDFRVNEFRTVKQSDFKKDDEFITVPKIEILHFFLLKSFRETNILTSPSYDRCRVFENETWKKYLPSENINEETKLAYHWKKSKIEEGQHFSVLATFSKKRILEIAIAMYALVFLLLNWFSSEFSNNFFTSFLNFLFVIADHFYVID